MGPYVRYIPYTETRYIMYTAAHLAQRDVGEAGLVPALARSLELHHHLRAGLLRRGRTRHQRLLLCIQLRHLQKQAGVSACTNDLNA